MNTLKIGLAALLSATVIAHPRPNVRKIRRGNHEISLKFSFPNKINALHA